MLASQLPSVESNQVKDSRCWLADNLLANQAASDIFVRTGMLDLGILGGIDEVGSKAMFVDSVNANFATAKVVCMTKQVGKTLTPTWGYG